MSGLILLSVLAIWGFVSFSLAKLIVKQIANPNIKLGANITLVALVFIAPVSDDIIGGVQFRSLCHDNAVVSVDEKKAKGKSVFFDSQHTDLKNYILKINNYHVNYRDIDTGEVVLSWNEYRAKGGWLSRLIGFPSGNPPYTFDGTCYPKDAFGRKSIFDRLQIKQVKK